MLVAGAGALGVAGYAAFSTDSCLFGAVVARSPTAVNSVALTFDDGPDPTVTPRILDALAAAGAHATFFLVGERAEAAPDLVKRIAASGHQIGNHSARHSWLPLHSRATIESDLAQTQASLTRIAGIAPTVFRPPYGCRDPRVLECAEQLSLTTVLWSVTPRDWQEPPAATIAERVLADVRSGDVVLLHDGDAAEHRGRPNTADALPAILAGLRARGLTPVRVDELLASQPRRAIGNGN